MTARHDRSRRERRRAVHVSRAGEDVLLLDVAEARKIYRPRQIQRRRQLRVIVGSVAGLHVRRDGASDGWVVWDPGSGSEWKAQEYNADKRAPPHDHFICSCKLFL